MYLRTNSWLGMPPAGSMAVASHSAVRGLLTWVPIGFALLLSACGSDSRVFDNTASAAAASKPAPAPAPAPAPTPAPAPAPGPVPDASHAIPGVPTGLAATAGNAQVSLSWSASAHASSYNLGRAATSSGPFTLIKNTTSTSFVDTGLTNGTTYFYVVSAADSAGSSRSDARRVGKDR